MPNRRFAVTLPLPTRSLPAFLAAAATLTIGLAGAGCGSSSKSSSASTTAALSKAQFVAQGNAICTRGNEHLTAAEKAVGPKPTEAQFKTYVASAFVPGIQSQIDGIRALGAPAADQASITSMLNVAQSDLNKVKGDPTTLTEKTFSNFAKLAHPYGLTACAPNS